MHFVTVCAAALMLLGVCAVNGLAVPPHRHHEVAPHHANNHNHHRGGVVAHPTTVTGDDKAVATVLVHQSLFTKLINAALPILIDDIRKLNIPGKSEKHFDFKDITLSEFDIGSLTIGFQAPNVVKVSLTDLSLKVPDTNFDIKDKVLFVHLKCSGDFSVEVKKTNIDIRFSMVDHDGKLGFDNGQATMHFGELNVQHKFHDVLCKIGQDIVQAFIGNINNLITNLVEKDISPMITKALDAAFAKLATKVTLPLAAPPRSTSDSMELVLNLLGFHHKMSKAQRLNRLKAAAPRNAVSIPSNFPNRDLEAFFTQESTNALLEHFYNLNHLNVHIPLPINTSSLAGWLPAAYTLCPDCQLELELVFRASPTVTYNAGVTASFGSVDSILAARPHHNRTTPEDLITLVEFNMNGTGGFDNFTIEGENKNTINFKLERPTLGLTLVNSTVGPIDASLLATVADFILDDVIVPDFNKHFSGVHIPTIDDVSVVGVVVDFKGAMDLGIDLDLSKL